LDILAKGITLWKAKMAGRMGDMTVFTAGYLRVQELGF
jgi:hypothetical protein